MLVGALPFKYLGVPLLHKKLTISYCFPFVENISKRVLHWSCKLLPYASRVILIKSVLASMKGYWFQLFLLQKKIIKRIENICRNFLWQGNEKDVKKA